MGQHQILPLFNLEQGAEFPTPASLESAKVELLDVCRRATLWFCFFKTGCIYLYFKWIPKQMALCGHEAISHTLPQLNCAPLALFPCRPQRFHGALQHVTRVPCELLTNAHGSKVFANVPVGRASAGAGYWPQDTNTSEIILHACQCSCSYLPLSHL